MRRVVLLCLSSLLALTVLAPSASSSVAVTEAGSAVLVSGTVTDATTGDGIGEVIVQVSPTGDEYPAYNPVATTAADGSFSFSIGPGRYLVRYDAHYLDPYAPQHWPLAHVLADADVLRVRAGRPVADLDAELVAGATITGRSYDEGTGAPVGRDFCVQVSPKGAEDERLGNDQVAEDGRWSVDRLPPVEVIVRVGECEYGSRFTYAYGAIDPDEAETFVLEAGESIAVGRVDVIEGGTITGTVTSHRTGEPIAGAEVRATPHSREGGPGDFSVRTDAAGRFVVEDVQPGLAFYPSATLRAEFGEKQRYAIGWRDGATDPRRAEPVVLESGGTTVANFQLRRSARLVLTIDEPYGEYLSLDALLRRLPGERWRHAVGGGGFWSESPTKAVIDGLPSTRIDLQFWGDDGHGQFWFDGVRDEAAATSVRPRHGQTLRIEAHLPDDWSTAADS